jgi:hypothetical protein
VTYTFVDTPVHVTGNQVVYVVTTLEGDCVSVLTDTEKIERQLSRGIWDDCFLYKVSEKIGVELVVGPK